MVHLIPTEQAADEQVLVDSKRLLANSSRISKISWTPGRPGQGRQGFPGPRGLFFYLCSFVDVFWPNFDWQAENLASQSETLLFLSFVIISLFSFAIHAVLFSF